MGTPSDAIKLLPTETELLQVKGDCWKTPGMIGKRQVPGRYTFTDQRILFRGNGLIEKLRITFALPYGEIASIKPCMVGLFIPTGIAVTCKDGGRYCLSVMKRRKVMELIEEQMQRRD